MIIPHTDKLLGLFILFCRDVDRRVIMMGQAPGNKRGVTLISLDLLSAFLLKHSGRCKDDAFHVMIRQLVVQRESEASSLITAYEQSIVSVVETHCLDVVDDFTVMTINLLRVFGLFLLICVAAKRERFLVNIHSNVDCAILHLMTSICMR